MGRWIKAFKKIGSDNRDTLKVQDNLEQYFAQFEKSPIIDGILLKNVDLVSGTMNVVPHKLTRKVKGWIVVRKNANADVWEDMSLEASPKLLYLQASATVTVDLWVF